MKPEPAFLASLGEFATLKSTIGGWYHQDAHLEFGTDGEIWQAIWGCSDGDHQVRLINQLVELLQRSDDEVLSVWAAQAHSHSFFTGAEAREFLAAMLRFFKNQPPERQQSA
jgi:hypothetical protein